MKTELEFHDSTLSEISEEGGGIVVRLRPAYVRSGDEGAVNGYAQDVDLHFFRARLVSRPEKLPIWISDGTLKMNGAAVYDAMMPIPFSGETGGIFFGITAESEAFRIEAAAITAASVGERRFIEKID